MRLSHLLFKMLQVYSFSICDCMSDMWHSAVTYPECSADPTRRFTSTFYYHGATSIRAFLLNKSTYAKVDMEVWEGEKGVPGWRFFENFISFIWLVAHLSEHSKHLTCNLLEKENEKPWTCSTPPPTHYQVTLGGILKKNNEIYWWTLKEFFSTEKITRRLKMCLKGK